MAQLKKFEIKSTDTGFVSEKVNSSQSAFMVISQFYGDDIEVYESFFILMLNSACKTVGYAKISQGGICGTVIDVRIIAKYAIDCLAYSVILAHNHPSGNSSPSNADVELTLRIKKALDLLDVKVIDHLILTNDGYYSFVDEGKMNREEDVES